MSRTAITDSEIYNVQRMFLDETLSWARKLFTDKILWSVCEIIHICTAFVDENEDWSSQ